MDYNIFLQSFNSKKSVNTSEGLNVSLKGKRRLLPTNDIGEVISQYDVYMDERNKCNIIRLTCQINTVCSNVLFNHISEIVKDEGSEKLTFINYGISGNTMNSGAVVSDKISFKKKNLGFWSGNTMTYQSTGTSLSVDSSSNKINPSSFSGYSSGLGKISSENVTHPTNSIRDTQISKDGYVYHCGLDILNNHLIRSKTFKAICPCDKDYSLNGDDDGYDGFNTIADMMRDTSGNKIVELVPYPVTAGVPNNAKYVAMHMYQYEDIYTFNECLEKKLKVKNDGWVGFYNNSKIKSYVIGSDDDLEMERPIMYKNSGDFIEMYPDRSLFSFTPKYNKYRNRYENNWNYCLTYPSSSVTNGFNDIIEASIDSLKAIYFNENTIADNGTKQLVIYSVAKHGLNVGDYINVYITREKDGEKVSEKIIDNAEVSEIADEYIFTVFNADVQISKTWVEITDEDLDNGEIKLDNDTKVFKLDEYTKKFFYSGDSQDVKYYIVNDNYVNFDNEAQNLSYKKVVNGVECDYYVRIFSKIPNFKYASADTTNEYEIYKNDGEVIKTYQDKQYDFESHPSRLAFAKNIYSDDIGEIVFTDDINIANLKDNLGRPLSTIYLTITKNNKGYKEWYGYDYPNDAWTVTEATSSNIEFSHCFGAVMCGFATSEESTINTSVQSINKLNKLTTKNLVTGYDVSKINGERDYLAQDGETIISINNYEIWFDKDKNYYGDLCCYDSYNAIEQSIEPILHRVNTAQRESQVSASVEYFNKFIHDEITIDDYNTENRYEIDQKIEESCNSLPEGYYYKPHYEIPIKSFGELQTIMPDFLTMRSLTNMEDGSTKIATMQKHFLSIGDKSMIYDMWNDKYYYCTTVKGSGDNDRTFSCIIYDENGKQVSLNNLSASASITFDSEDYNAEIASTDLFNFKLFKIDNLGVPSYARIIKDGTCRFAWRNIINNGMDENIKSIEEYPFTNGAFYINKKVDLYLRRQDPYDIYDLYSENDIFGNDINYESEDNYVKEDDMAC